MKTYNWGIIGTGFIARKMAEALPFVPQSNLFAVASRNIETASDFASTYNCKPYGSYEELITDPEIDIVYVATPHNYHCENTLTAISNGKHVLCEKPFAVNSREVHSMIDAAREKGVFLMEALWTRFNPNIIRAKEILDSGQLGKIKLISANFGDRKPFHPDNRFYSKELIGGALLDMGIYPLFNVLLMMGKPMSIKALAAIGSTGVDHTCSIALRYEDDAMAVIHSTMLAETESKVTIYCEKGKIELSRWVYAPEKVTVIPLDGESQDVTQKITGNIYNYEAVEVINCLELGKIQSSLWSWDDSLMLMGVLDEIRAQIGFIYEAHDS